MGPPAAAGVIKGGIAVAVGCASAYAAFKLWKANKKAKARRKAKGKREKWTKKAGRRGQGREAGRKARQKKRTGLRIRGARGHREVRAALIRYAPWLRRNYEFPIRVPVYLSPLERITVIDGTTATGFFFGPRNRNEEPCISMATGDYASLKKEDGRDNTLAAFICCLNHELVHYWQWIETGDLWERGVERKADAMLRRYALTVDHP